MALGLAGVGRALVEPTEAAWRTEHSATGTFTAATIPAARLTGSCQYRSGVLGLGARVVIYWAAPDDYDLDDAQLWASRSGLGSVLAPLTGFSLADNTTYDARTDRYTTTVPTNLLGGLLGLGSELEVSIVMTRHGWTSPPASIATNAGLLAGLGGTCRNLT